jgi:hypothetical protein
VTPGDPIAVHWDNGVKHVITRGQLVYLSPAAVAVKVDNARQRIPWELVEKVRVIT